MLEEIKALPIRTKILAIILFLVLSSFLYNWYHKEPVKASKEFVYVEQAKGVKKVGKKEVPLNKIEAYKKPDIYDKVPLPENVKTDEKKEVISVVDTPKSKSGTTVVTTVDTATGRVDTYQKELPLPLFSFENEKKIGAGFGYTSRGAQTARLYGEYTFIRVGSFYGSLRGELNANLGLLDSQTELKALANIEYRP